MPEAFNAQVGAIGGGKDNKGRVRPRFEKRVTLKILTDWINEQNYDEYTKRELIKKASSYPYNSFRYFADNINQQIIAIREERDKLRKERDERERACMQSELLSVSAESECLTGDSNESGAVPTAGMPGGDNLSAEREETGDGEPAASPLPS